MAYTLKSNLHVAMCIDGVAVNEDYGPGDVELPEAVAQLLVAQGFASEAKPKAVKAVSNDEIGE